MRIETPYRAEHTYVQKYPEFPPEAVFPMLCPVREAEWVAGWDPVVVYTHSGVAETGCTFITSQDGRDAVWYIVRHDPEHHAVEMVKITPQVTACRLRIDVRADGKGGCEAEVTYSHTALGQEGRSLVDQFTAETYREQMEHWEQSLTACLSGK